MKQKITMFSQLDAPVQEYFKQYLISCTAKGLSETTLKTYESHFNSLSKFLDTTIAISDLNRTDVEQAIVSMREKKLSPNSIASYIRVFKAFISWCNEEGYCNLTIPNFKPTETVKETYSDGELARLLKRPSPDCSFSEFRNWIVIQFLLNCGCRAATIRNIKNKDVDLDSRQITFRHTKVKKVQVIPLSSTMVSSLKRYMSIRKGELDDYLFCTETGEMFTREGFSSAIERYNKSRGVEKTSIHMFRHTFARKYLLDCGGNALTLQKLLGHSTLEMTKHYCNIFDADIAKNFDSISPLEKLSSKERIKK